jgi:hypothetical protein
LIGSLLFLLLFPAGKNSSPPEGAQLEIQGLIREGENALHDGDFHSARKSLSKARELAGHSSHFLTKYERDRLQQLSKQAHLLADLLKEPLENMLHLLSQCKEQQREEVFQDYWNKSVVFHATVWRDGTGRYHCDYHVLDGNEEARVEWGGLELLRDLPQLREPHQLLFGARLAGVRREPPAGNWVISFIPDSGVLITHPGAARACCFQPFDAGELEQVINKQADWVAELSQAGKSGK